jgi:putative ABC transport system permease protein
MRRFVSIALRNLSRYRRRSVLTMAIIMFGVALVIVFSGFMNSFKKNMIGAITGGLLGEIQVHAKGYVESIDNLPLYIRLDPEEYRRAAAALTAEPSVAAFSPRIKFGAMLSDYSKTAQIRVLAVDPTREMSVCANLSERVEPSPDPARGLLRNGEIVLPASIAKSFGLGLGDEVVVVATNESGSINAATLRVVGTSGSVTDPSGRDAYVSIDDAMAILQMDEPRISEIAIRLKDPDRLEASAKAIDAGLSGAGGAGDEPEFETHTWKDLSPVVPMITILDILLLVSKLIMVVIVLISIMNVMVMSVYERFREIGTMAAIGTIPAKILAVFMIEGVSMAVIGAAIGTGLGLLVNEVISAISPTFVLGRMMKVVLTPYVSVSDVASTALIAIVVASLASLEPAAKAASLEPVDAMRQN